MARAPAARASTGTPSAPLAKLTRPRLYPQVRLRSRGHRRKFGFEVEGTARAFGFQAGRYVDVHLMARVRLPGS